MIRTLVAATVPLESAVPCALTHLPTCNEVEVVDATVLITVLAPAVTVTEVGAALDPLAPRCCAATTIVEPETELTVPVMNDPAPAARPGPPEGKPDGRPPPPVRGVPPPAAPPPPPPKPALHVPFTGAVTVTVAAVKADAEEVVPVAAAAVRQSPALIVDRAAVTVWVKLVELLQDTATCPLC